MSRSHERAASRDPRPALGAGPGRPTAGLVGTLLALFVAGCGASPDDERWRIVERLSHPPDAEVFSLAEVTRETEVRAWRLSEPAQAALWQVEPQTARGTVGRRGLQLFGGNHAGGDLRLTTEVEIDARQVSVVELRLRNPSRAPSQLLWAAPGEEFTSRRRITLPESDRHLDRGPILVYRFPVGDHAEWRGAVRRLQIRPATGARRDFAAISVRLLESRASVELLSAAVSRPWKVDLRATVREAGVAFPGLPWRATVRVPDGESELRFRPGLSAEPTGEVELSVRAAQPDGSETVLFSWTYSPQEGHAGGWQDPVRVPLSSLAGQELELVFATMTEGSKTGAGEFTAWANAGLAVRSGEPSPPNVILICIDTLRADRLSAYGNRRKTTPNIDRWAATDAVLFRNVVATSPWTLPSFISIFTGLDSIRHGGNHHLPARNELEMLAETLLREGYETAAFTGGGYLGPAHGLHQGFESFRYHLGRAEDELAANTDRVVEWLGPRRDRPFFLLFHTYEVHGPFLERQPFYQRFAEQSGLPPIPYERAGTRRRPLLPEEGYVVSQDLMMSADGGETWQPVPPEARGAIFDRYDSGIAYTDAQVGRILDAIAEQRLARESVVILTSDHGEGLGEQGFHGHSYLHDFNLLVPLIIAAPSADWPGGRTVTQQARLIDIVPTVRELVGLAPDGDLDGESLTPLVFDRGGAVARPAWSYGAISNRGVSFRLPGLKYLFNNSAPRPVFGQERLFDLDDDPEEADDVAERRPGDAARLRRMVRRRLTEDVGALWFRLRSGSRHPLTVELAGAGIGEPSRLKAVELPGDGIRYREEPERGAVIELPPSTEALLYSESQSGAAVRLRAASVAPDIAPREWRIVLRDLATRPWSARLTEGSWIEASTPAADAEAFLSVFITRELRTDTASAETSREIEDQLRALGYLQ